ncbi:MAG TPA: hypothetical protein DC049_09820, partial [Spirochaetia bacterium]|nr:hypothetical protein [Spirochaetia bacterium]
MMQFIILIIFILSAGAAADLPINGGFEEGEGDAALHWQAKLWKGPQGSFGRTDKKAKTGRYAFFLECTEASKEKGNVQLRHDVMYLAEKVSAIVISGWYIGGKAQNTAVKIRFYRKDGEKSSELGQASAGLVPAEKWTMFSKELAIPAAAVQNDKIYFQPEILIYTPDFLYIDDLKIEIKGKFLESIGEKNAGGKTTKGKESAGGPVKIMGRQLSAEEKKWYSRQKPAFDLICKNGIVYKNSRPVFLLGSAAAGTGQHNGGSSLWWPRVWKHDFVERYPHANKYIQSDFNTADRSLTVSFNDNAWDLSQVREMYRMNTFVWFDNGTSKNIIALQKYREQIPIINEFHREEGQKGHYPFDHAHPLGAELYKKSWEYLYQYYNDEEHPFLGMEYFNELRYTCFSDITVKAFQKYMLAKYRSLDKINGIFRTSFLSASDIKPVEKWKEFGKSYHLKNFVIEQIKIYPEFRYEWLEFLRVHFKEHFAPL